MDMPARPGHEVYHIVIVSSTKHVNFTLGKQGLQIGLQDWIEEGRLASQQTPLTDALSWCPSQGLHMTAFACDDCGLANPCCAPTGLPSLKATDCGDGTRRPSRASRLDQPQQSKEDSMLSLGGATLQNTRTSSPSRRPKWAGVPYRTDLELHISCCGPVDTWPFIGGMWITARQTRFTGTRCQRESPRKTLHVAAALTTVVEIRTVVGTSCTKSHHYVF